MKRKMFDSPRKISMMQKNIGLLDFDLENISVGKKPNTLPPLINADKSYNTAQQNNNHKNVTRTASHPQPLHRRLSSNNPSLSSSPRDTDFTHNNNVDMLIKETAKQRLNDFDTLCAQLVQQTEDGRRQRKQSTRPDTPSHYKPSQPVNRKNTFRINDSDNNVFETEEESMSTQYEKRPKTSTTSRAERPKTGYGRRRRPNMQDT